MYIFFSKRRYGGGREEWTKRHKTIHQGSNNFISAQQQVLLKTYHPPEEIHWFLWVQRWGALCMRKHEFWPDPWWSPTCKRSVRGLLIPAKRPAFPFSLPHLLPALSCLFWMVSRCGSWMTGVQWKQTAVLRASSTYLLDVNDVTGRPRQETAYLLLCPDACSGLPQHLGKPRSWGKWSRIPAPYSGEPPLQEECTSTPVPDSRGWRHRYDLPGFTSSHAGGITWAISWYQHFLPPPLSGSSGLPGGSPVSPGLLGEVPSLPRPSWGSPQPRQAFLEGLPNFPGSFLRAQGYGGRRQSDPWVTYCVLQTHSLQLCVCWNPRPWALQLHFPLFSSCLGAVVMDQASAEVLQVWKRCKRHRACHHPQIPASLFPPNSSPPPLPFNRFYLPNPLLYIAPPWICLSWAILPYCFAPVGFTKPIQNQGPSWHVLSSWWTLPTWPQWEKSNTINTSNDDVYICVYVQSVMSNSLQPHGW